MNIPSLPQSVSYNREFVRCLEQGLRRYDERLSWVVFSKFEKDYALSREDIIQKPELFSKTIRQIFRFGSTYVEKALVKELRNEVQLRDRDYSGLADAILEIKQSNIK